MRECPKCSAEWPRALWKPFRQQICPACRREKQRRLDYVVRCKEKEIMERQQAALQRPLTPEVREQARREMMELFP